jgi:hypothetical protein
MARTRASAAVAGPQPARSQRKATRAAQGTVASPAPIVLDRHRAFIFPNHIREQRRLIGLQKLMALSELLPDIPYIRLSKIERGEVIARASELERIARALGVGPRDLLADVSKSDFDIARWAQPFIDSRPVPEPEEQFAVMLAAALRHIRNADASLTIAVLDQDYGIPPVILSRLENAYKPFDRWNDATVASLCRLFGVADEAALRAQVQVRYRNGDLDALVGRIADPAVRLARTQAVIAALRDELSASTAKPAARVKAPKSTTAAPAPTPIVAEATPRVLPVLGAPLPGGVIAATPTEAVVEAPSRAGPRAFALRVGRATLGAGLPAGSVVVADPDRRPTAGGIAAIRSQEGFRLVTVTFDRLGATKGYSVSPDLELDLDDLDPADVASVIAAFFP